MGRLAKTADAITEPRPSDIAKLPWIDASPTVTVYISVRVDDTSGQR